MEMNLPIVAGMVSTILFALSALPMLKKAFQTKDLRSYSLGNILLSNVGNLLYTIYVFYLPPGPIWLLHAFYLVTMGLMLVWYLRYEWQPTHRSRMRPSQEQGTKLVSDHKGELNHESRTEQSHRTPFLGSFQGR